MQWLFYASRELMGSYSHCHGHTTVLKLSWMLCVTQWHELSVVGGWSQDGQADCCCLCWRRCQKWLITLSVREKEKKIVMRRDLSDWISVQFWREAHPGRWNELRRGGNVLFTTSAIGRFRFGPFVFHCMCRKRTKKLQPMIDRVSLYPYKNMTPQPGE